MSKNKMQVEIEKKVNKKIAPLFSKYNIDFSGLESSMKWKPIVLIIGNYSSGKSTLINEIIGKDVQRTGQAPTDDAFTILTSEGSKQPKEVPGSTLVNDDQLPFVKFKKYGKRFISHFCLKNVDSPNLEDLAIIDSPGMLDATTEKDRGYDYFESLGEFAKMADRIILMFDPHKAGTIKETYTAIRNTLPEKSGEDRIVFVMSRIDECDNLSDLVRSYGTLCWNMSQMTGRKDIPHIFLTYSSQITDPSQVGESWPQEREQLIEKIQEAPDFRINHILEDIDRQVNELKIVSEAMTEFTKRGRRLFKKIGKISLGVALFLLCFGDVITNSVISLPREPLFTALRNGTFTPVNLIVPLTLFIITLVVGMIIFNTISFKLLLKRTLDNTHDLITLDSEYRNNLWLSMKDKVRELLLTCKASNLWQGHSGNLSKIQHFLDDDLKEFYNSLNR